MFALVIDTSSAAVTAAVVEITADVQVLARRVSIDARAHGELLAPSIEGCLTDSGRSVADIGAVVVGLGPGPFTGLRVGLVTAAVFAAARGVPAYGVCSLDGLASASAGALLVATDARRREIYWARYADGRRVEGPSVSRPADVDVALSTQMTGAGARLYRDVLGLPLRDVDYPSPLVLASLAAERIRTGAPSEPLTPLYLRRPDAVAPGASKPVSQGSP